MLQSVWVTCVSTCRTLPTKVKGSAKLQIVCGSYCRETLEFLHQLFGLTCAAMLASALVVVKWKLRPLCHPGPLQK